MKNFNVITMPGGVVRGETRAIHKDPVTDSGEKKSFKGRVGLVFDADGGIIGTKDQLGPEDPHGFSWTPLEDGKFEEPSEGFSEVRKRTGVWQ